MSESVYHKSEQATLTIYPNGHLELTIRKELAEEFKQLVQRGSNLYPDSSPAIKELADLITLGRIQQDYFAQANKKRG